MHSSGSHASQIMEKKVKKKGGKSTAMCFLGGEEKAAEDVHTKTTEGLRQVFKHIPSATFV